MDGVNGLRETDLAGSRRVSLVSGLNSQLFRQNRWSGWPERGLLASTCDGSDRIRSRHGGQLCRR